MKCLLEEEQTALSTLKSFGKDQIKKLYYSSFLSFCYTTLKQFMDCFVAQIFVNKGLPCMKHIE